MYKQVVSRIKSPKLTAVNYFKEFDLKYYIIFDIINYMNNNLIDEKYGYFDEYDIYNYSLFKVNNGIIEN